MTRLRRGLQVTLDLLDWRTFAVAGAFATLLLVGLGFFQALSSASQATQALAAQSAQQQDARRATTRRIDLLNAEIQRLNRDSAAGRDARGQLAAQVAALAEQVKQMGGRPVATATATPPGPSPRPSAADPSGRATAAPRPASPAPRATASDRPTATPSARPTPSPTCRRLPLVGCLSRGAP